MLPAARVSQIPSGLEGSGCGAHPGPSVLRVLSRNLSTQHVNALSRDRFAHKYAIHTQGHVQGKMRIILLGLSLAFHLRNGNHNQNTAAVSPLEKTNGWTLFLRHLVSKIRKVFLMKHLRPVPEIIQFSEQGNAGNGREGRQ